MAPKTASKAPRPAKAPADDYSPAIRIPPPGPKAKEIIAKDAEFITPSYTRSYPLVIERGEGMFVFDTDGNRFLDFTAGVAVNALGHGHPEVALALAKQASKFVHMAGTDFYYGVMADFAEKICTLAPGPGPKQCFLTNSGTESVEAAIKLARFATRRPRLIAFFNAFHGRSLGSLSLTASKPGQRRGFSPLLSDVSHGIFNDLDFLHKYLFGKTCPPEDVAAIFVEPIQGEGGYNIATKEFMSGLRKACDKHGILLVVDEIQTGMGRTGKMFAIEHFDVAPDVLCVAKPVGGGLPLGAMIARKDLHVWPSGAHANTFGGNPVACAAGLKVIELIERGAMRNAAKMGEVLSRRLASLAAKHDHVFEERGLGLMRAIEIVRSKASRAPDHDRRDAVVRACFERGLLLLGCGETAIRFLPALIVEKGHIDAACDILDAVLGFA
ncbi:MAG TPA: aminotransferase class III-fold pyridoxal phosphate-dependent enzyme [Planctomycetota bacterium]|nr:aminotransferase class III-fold pyridoxal phosphate-dependent enzyme [Planctomycetota bacterium]